MSGPPYSVLSSLAAPRRRWRLGWSLLRRRKAIPRPGYRRGGLCFLIFLPRLLLLHQHLVDALAVHVHHLEGVAAPGDAIPRCGEASELRQDEAAERLELAQLLARQLRHGDEVAERIER